MARAGVQTAAEAVIPRGTIIGRPVGDPPKVDAEHFIRCPTCDGWIDCRDLGQVFGHEGPLPHESTPTAAALIRQQAHEIDDLWDRLSRAYALVRQESPAEMIQEEMERAPGYA